MKKLLIIFFSSLLFISCGEEESKKTCDKEKCSKECLDKGHKDCKKECEKSCGDNDKEKKRCGVDCEKECCVEKVKGGISEQLEIGALNPSLDAKMRNTDGQDIALSDLKKETGTLVIFSCNTCPFVVGREGKSEGWENRYMDILSWADKYKIGFALINSNEAKRENDEGVDTYHEMVKRAKEKYDNRIEYLLDKNHVVADAFGARTTPHVYLFDKNDKLVYRGAIDDNVDKKDEVKEQYLADAMKNLYEGKEISPNVTKNLGCSIKRIKKSKD